MEMLDLNRAVIDPSGEVMLSTFLCWASGPISLPVSPRAKLESPRESAGVCHAE